MASRSAGAPPSRAASGLQVRLLGPVEVVRDGCPVRLPGPKPVTLLVLLAIHVGETVPAGRLIESLWAGQPPPSADAVLRTYVAQLRRALGAGVIGTSADGYALRLDPACVDARLFEQQLAQARAGPSPRRAEVTAAQLRRALALWRGTAFGELAPAAFAAAETQRLEELRLAALEDRLDADLAAGRHATVIAELRQLVTEQPLRDRLRGQLIVALYRSGRPAEALDAYQDYRRLLMDELGVEPSPGLRQLQRAVLAHDPSLGLPAGPGPAGQPAAPPAGRRDNLPTAISSFVGRAAETSEVTGLVDRHRLVTLTGAGGCGKTRLALEAGARQDGLHADGVWLAELAALTRPEHVLPTVAAVWGLQDQGTGQLADRVAAYLADRDLLLIIDNCEHVLAAAAGLIRTLLRAAPLLRVLATSREPLGAEGEVCWLVPSLGLPAGDAGLAVAEAANADAVRLFAERAAQARPGFALTAGNAAAVSEICRRLDGIPLAIELAAARVRALTPQEIAGRLDERFTLLSGGPRAVLPRHRTLRALTDWSWDLLTPPERELCRRLAVFAGGFTLAAAEAVSGGQPAAGDVLAHVTALVEKSLLTAEPQGETTRYGMLETIRQYAREQLAAAGEEPATRDRHLTWAAGLYEAAEAGLTGPGQEAWAATCGAELDNARAGLAWALQTGRTGDGMRIASVSRLWQFLGLLTEGRDWLDRLLAGPAPADPRRRAWAMNVVGYLACLQRDLPAARAYLEQALAQHTEIGQPSEALRALNSLVCVAFAEEDLPGVRRLLAAAPDWARRTGNSSERARTMMLACRLAIKDGGTELAEAVARESLATYQRKGDKHGMTSPLEFLGEIAYRQGDLPAARGHLEEGLALARAICKVCTQNLLAELAEVAAAEGGDPAEVTSLRAERDRLQVELGLPPRDPWTD